MSAQTQYLKIKNGTSVTISLGNVTHATEDYGIQTISLDGLAPGQETDIQSVITGPGSRDYWYITWQNEGITGQVSWFERTAISSHTDPSDPGTLTLRGNFNTAKNRSADLQVEFQTDGTSTDTYTITNPWD